jgi:hypothetical protein
VIQGASKLPVKGSGVSRSGQFPDVARLVMNHGFTSGAPGRMVSPGFYFYHRGAYVIQILPDRQIGITRPNGMVETESVERMTKANFILSAIVRYIEAAEEN